MTKGGHGLVYMILQRFTFANFTPVFIQNNNRVGKKNKKTKHRNGTKDGKCEIASKNWAQQAHFSIFCIAENSVLLKVH